MYIPGGREVTGIWESGIGGSADLTKCLNPVQDTKDVNFAALSAVISYTVFKTIAGEGILLGQ